MTPHIHFQHLAFLIGSGLVLAVIALLAISLVHKTLRQRFEAEDLNPPKVRLADESAFTLATMQAVIAQLKNEQKANQEKLAIAEQRADQNARQFELIAREVDQGLMVFDREGFITFANARVRKALAVDTWSRRRYGEIFASIPKLVELIAASLDAAVETRNEKVPYQSWDESTQAMEVSVFPVRDRSGETEGVACLFREVSS